jgi:hypothetical protein
MAQEASNYQHNQDILRSTGNIIKQAAGFQKKKQNHLFPDHSHSHPQNLERGLKKQIQSETELRGKSTQGKVSAIAIRRTTRGIPILNKTKPNKPGRKLFSLSLSLSLKGRREPRG